MTKKPIVIADPEIMSGEPCFVGTRVPVRALLDYIEGGETLDEFFPKDLALELPGHTVKTVPQAEVGPASATASSSASSPTLEKLTCS